MARCAWCEQSRVCVVGVCISSLCCLCNRPSGLLVWQLYHCMYGQGPACILSGSTRYLVLGGDCRAKVPDALQMFYQCHRRTGLHQPDYTVQTTKLPPPDIRCCMGIDHPETQGPKELRSEARLQTAKPLTPDPRPPDTT